MVTCSFPFHLSAMNMSRDAFILLICTFSRCMQGTVCYQGSVMEITLHKHSLDISFLLN